MNRIYTRQNLFCARYPRSQLLGCLSRRERLSPSTPKACPGTLQLIIIQLSQRTSHLMGGFHAMTTLRLIDSQTLRGLWSTVPGNYYYEEAAEKNQRRDHLVWASRERVLKAKRADAFSNPSIPFQPNSEFRRTNFASIRYRGGMGVGRMIDASVKPNQAPFLVLPATEMTHHPTRTSWDSGRSNRTRKREVRTACDAWWWHLISTAVVLLNHVGGLAGLVVSTQPNR
jgi:hypothetical protein